MIRIITSLTAFALSLIAPALLVETPSWHVQADDDQDGGIVGTWILDATLAPGFTERELIAITPGGTFTITSAVFNAHTSENPFLPPFFMVDLSDGYGAWKRQGNSSRFSVTFKRHLFAGPKTPSSLYGTFFLGQNVGEGTVQSVAILQHGEDGDTLQGPFTFQLRNLRGEVMGAGSGTISAKRLKIEPLAAP